jgi:competence ComEA-like helix-hairpin-helix protein
VGLYDRRQLVLLLGLLAAAGTGLAVREWRQARPDLVERLEQLDRDATPPATVANDPDATRSRPAATTGSRFAKRESAAPVDLNRASAEELTRLPGVGAGLAARIVALREAEGGFASVDDLRKIRGLGRARLERLRPLLTASE